ncbi:unnamed protein product [Linum tenue]|uniref:Uncharacterized protein n=1 Tax=Linum tenue TaxID=586396 RepID=A0AAV0R2D6_9ROSI|nr:unnamed protein product [Linum tenue]
MGSEDSIGMRGRRAGDVWVPSVGVKMGLKEPGVDLLGVEKTVEVPVLWTTSSGRRLAKSFSFVKFARKKTLKMYDLSILKQLRRSS